MKTIFFIPGTALVSALAGCSTPPMALNRVGPAPVGNGGSASSAKDWLVVNTATETRQVGDYTYYYPHTGYSIYTKAGKFCQYVPNHIGDTDESAARVGIPAGKYTVDAESDFGPVIVPVLIEDGKTTEVNLDTSGEKYSRTTNNTSIVWFPTGRSSTYYAVGWRAAARPTNNK